MSSESQNRELKIRKIKTKPKYIKYAANTIVAILSENSLRVSDPTEYLSYEYLS
jgi:hypothetical protein